MPALLLLVMLALAPPAGFPANEVSDFAARAAKETAEACAASNDAAKVGIRVEDVAGTGNGEQLLTALRDAVRAQHLSIADGESTCQVNAFLSRRDRRPLAIARLMVDGVERTALFATFSTNAPAGAAETSGPVVAIRTRTLLTSELPVLDLDADAAGNLFLLHPDRLRVLDLTAGGLPLKTELGLDTGAERLRDPLVRLVLRDSPRQIEIYSAAPSVPNPPPAPVEGYTIKAFPASAQIKLPHAWRVSTATVTIATGRNFFRLPANLEVYGIAPVVSPLRAYWASLDTSGILRLLDADERALAPPAAGQFGSDVASVALPCAGTVVLAPGNDIAPRNDRISILRIENDRLLPYTSVEVEGAVRRLKALPGAGDARRVLAVTALKGGSRIIELELQCAP